MQSFPYIGMVCISLYWAVCFLSCSNNIRPFFDSDADDDEADPIFITEISVDYILVHCIHLNDIC